MNDVKATMGTPHRQGSDRLKHVDTNALCLQEKVASGDVTLDRQDPVRVQHGGHDDARAALERNPEAHDGDGTCDARTEA